MSRLIWNLLLLHTVIRRFLSTYHSNLTFLKAAKSGGKTVMILILKVCLRLLYSFEIIFRQETSSVLQQKSQKWISSAFFYFLLVEIFSPRAGDQKSYFFTAKAQNEWGVLEAIQWKILFVREFFFRGTFCFTLVCYSISTCTLSVSSITLD